MQKVSNAENPSPALYKPTASMYSEEDKMNRQSEPSQRNIKLITPIYAVYPTFQKIDKYYFLIYIRAKIRTILFLEGVPV